MKGCIWPTCTGFCPTSYQGDWNQQEDNSLILTSITELDNIFQNKCGWQNGGCPLQRVNNISMLFSHNLGIDVDELLVYENAIVYGLQFSQNRPFTQTERMSRESNTKIEPETLNRRNPGQQGAGKNVSGLANWC